MTRRLSARQRREAMMRAAARVFAEAGYRGATTRRIAAEAGVNEVTLFRHFGSKEELIREAIAFGAEPVERPGLPAEPVDPRAELTAFARGHLEHLHRIRSLIRTCLGEGEERPEVLARAMERPILVHHELHSYLRRLQAAGLAAPDADMEAAATMLMGVLFADAMGRDYMPEAYPGPRDEAPGRYVKLVLESVGMRSGRRSRRNRERQS